MADHTQIATNLILYTNRLPGTLEILDPIRTEFANFVKMPIRYQSRQYSTKMPNRATWTEVPENITV